MVLQETTTYTFEMSFINSSGVDFYPRRHLEAVKTYWMRKLEINLDKSLHGRTSDKVEILERRKHLRKFVLLEKYAINHLTRLTRRLEPSFRSLEYLYITGPYITNNVLKSFSILTTLKHIHFNIKNGSSKNLERIFLHNPMLQYACLEGNIPDMSFQNIMKNIIKLVLLNTMGKRYTKLFSYLRSCHIESLHLIGLLLKRTEVRQLYQLNTLVSVSLCLDSNVSDADLQQLIHNNKRLKKFSIQGFGNKINGSCLTRLPTCLKTLELDTHSTIQEKNIISCLRSRKIANLSLRNKGNNKMLFTKLATVRNNLKTLTIAFDTCSATTLRELKHLRQLKSLELIGVLEEHKEAVLAIVHHCSILRKLTLESEHNLKLLWGPRAFATVTDLEVSYR